MSKKVSSTIIFSLVALSTLTGCNMGGNNGGDDSGIYRDPSSEPTSITEQRTPHYVEGTLHINNSKETNDVFAEVGVHCDYKIVADVSIEKVSKAVAFINKHLANSCGFELEIINPSDVANVSNSDSYIILDSTRLFEGAGLSMPSGENNIGNDGYYVKSVGKSVFIQAKNTQGYQLGSIAFLHELIGYEYLNWESVFYTKAYKVNEIKMINFDITEKPDFPYRIAPGYSNSTYLYESGCSPRNPVISPSKDGKTLKWIHNIYDALGGEEGYAEHPDWFTSEQAHDAYVGGALVREVCYTAHGNETEYNALVNELVKICKEAMLSNPDLNNFSLTQMDAALMCQCDECSRYAKPVEQGGVGLGSASMTGTIIRLYNDVDDIVQAWIQDSTRDSVDVIPTDHEFNFVFLSYSHSLIPPVKLENGLPKKNAEGKYEPFSEEFVCNEHVCPMYAPSSANYVDTLYDDSNSSFKMQAESWGAVASKLFIWQYATNFGNYLYPYDSFEASLEDYRFYKNLGAALMFDLNAYDNVRNPGFTGLKMYLAQNGMINVNIKYQEYAERYFKYSFFEAAEPMKKLYEFERAWCQKLKEDNIYIGGVQASNVSEKASYWPIGLINTWEELIDEGFAAIKRYKETDPELYQTLYSNILLESLTPRFIHLSLHPETYSSEKLTELRIQFRNDVIELGVNLPSEHTVWSDYWNTWGI